MKDADTSHPKSLKIGVDARLLVRKEPTGVERVLYHFVENLPPDHQYVLFVDEPDRSDYGHLPYQTVVEPVRFPRVQRIFDAWLVFQVGRLIPQHGVECFFTPHTKLPATHVPCYTTVHGLEWYFHSSGYRNAEYLKQWGWFQACSRFSAGIVTFAENTHRDIRRLRPHLRIPVVVIPEGVDRRFRRLSPGELSEETLSRLKLEKPFLLSVCSLEPRKNLEGLLRAFAKIKVEQGFPHKLALVGKDGWKAEQLKTLAENLGVSKEIRFLGYVGDDELVELYNQATLFVYPSKYEGFGLPLLEAMACGVPVVASNRSALPEVAGEAAILVDPFSPESIADGMTLGLCNEKMRNALITAGYERASSFSWQDTSRRICEFMARGGSS